MVCRPAVVIVGAVLVATGFTNGGAVCGLLAESKGALGDSTVEVTGGSMVVEAGNGVVVVGNCAVTVGNGADVVMGAVDGNGSVAVGPGGFGGARACAEEKV